MANGHGGPRTPANPAPVSGPGAHSRRTDGRPGDAQSMSTVPDQPYGDAKQQMADQRIAPMGGAPQMPPPPNIAASDASSPQQPQYGGGPLNAPSGRPHEPVTAGAELGPGPGPSVLPNVAAQPTGAMTQMLQQLSATDATGVLAALYQTAQQRGV